MNILILRVSAIGDVIHTLPSIFLIKKSYPKAQISWVVQEKTATLLVNQPFLKKTYVLPNKFLSKKNIFKTWKIVKEIKKNKWDIIIDFQGLLKTSILSFFITGQKFGFDKKNARLGLTSFFTHKQITPNYKNIIQKNLALTTGVLQQTLKSSFKYCPTIESIKKNFKLNISPIQKNLVNQWLKKNNINKFIILSPNTTWPSKHWPEENWCKLLNILYNKKLNKHQIILLGKDFGEQAKNISNYCNTNNIKIFVVPKWNLLQTAYLISKSSLLVAPDTGILHITDFLQKKSIGIFGPTSAIKHGPFLFKENIKNVIQIKCNHFYKKTHGKNKTYSRKLNCMYKLSPDMLLKKILLIIGE